MTLVERKNDQQPLSWDSEVAKTLVRYVFCTYPDRNTLPCQARSRACSLPLARRRLNWTAYARGQSKGGLEPSADSLRSTGGLDGR